MQQGFGVILLADEYVRARRASAAEMDRMRADARLAASQARPRRERRLSVRLPRFILTFTLTPIRRAACDPCE